MNIVFLNLYQGKVNRGAETFVNELTSRLSKNHRVDVIEGNNSPAKRWPFLWRFYLDPPGIRVMLFTLKHLPILIKSKFNVIVPLNGGWQAALIRLITWITRSKMVISGQSGMGWDDINNLWCFPDVFVAITPKALRWTKKVNPRVKSVYIPNGVDLDRFNPTGTKATVNLAKPVVLAAGALTKSKRLDLTIKALAKLGNTSLLIVGDGEMKNKLTNMGRKMLRDRFKLISAKHENMPEIYRAADVFTLVPQTSEAFGIVYVEAMATNLPVIATIDPQRRHIIGKAGILVDPENISEYALAIDKALNTKWGIKPRNQAKKFDWDAIACSYEKLLSSL